jgi:hypothetical protein
LRSAIKELSLTLTEIFSCEAGVFFENPWLARDGSIGLLRDNSGESIKKFFHDQARRALDPEEKEKALALLEMARQDLAMQTSCAWFFDDIADREAVQIMRFAARAIQIARDQTGSQLEQIFIDQLSAIRGNRPQYPDGGVVYRDCVLPLVLPPEHHAACLALIDSAGERTCVLHANAFSGEFLSYGELIPWHDLSLLGRTIRYCFMSKGVDTALLGLASPTGKPAEVSRNLLTTLHKRGYLSAAEKLTALFPCVVPFAEFPPAGKRLLRRSHLDRMTRAFNEVAGALFDRYADLEDAGTSPRFAQPGVNHLARYVLTCRIEEMLSSPDSDADDLYHLVAALSDWGIDTTTVLHPVSGRFITRLMKDWVCHPEDRDRLATVVKILTIIRRVGVKYPEWNLQNLFIGIRDSHAKTREPEKLKFDEEEVAWLEQFRTLGHLLGVSVPGGESHRMP